MLDLPSSSPLWKRGVREDFKNHKESHILSRTPVYSQIPLVVGSIVPLKSPFIPLCQRGTVQTVI
jgi:hypothetical protein